jgi:non-homologous end joining protein Ku
MLRIAEHILETKTADFDPAFLEDRYRTVLVEMLRSRQAELPTTISAPPSSPENVINLMDALKRSLAADRLAAGKATAKAGTLTSKPSSAKRLNTRGRKSG